MAIQIGGANMSYSIGQGSLFGRIGSGVGQGLAEALPKEVDRGRLSQGLQQFEKDSANLSPMQQMARLSAIPGITPQMIQSFAELAKQQNIRNAYGKGRRGTEDLPERTPRPDLQGVRFANLPENVPQRKGYVKTPSDFATEEAMATSQPGINDLSPVRPEAIPRNPWTAEKKREVISQLYDDFPNLTNAEIMNMASDMESRELSQPLAEQERDRFFAEKKTEADQEFDKQFETKLQRAGDKTYVRS